VAFQCRLTLSVALSLLLFVSGCGKKAPQIDPVTQAITTYKNLVEPPIQESEQIAKFFVQIVLEDKADPDPDRVAEQLKTKIVPAATTCAEKVQGIKPADKNLNTLHQYLVDAAQYRLEGYQEMLQGYQQNDMELFTQGQKKMANSKIKEDDYISRMNLLMRAHGLELHYFAVPPAIN